MERLLSFYAPLYAQINLRDVTIKIQDGTTPTPNEIEIKIGEGNVTWSEARTIEYTLNRNVLDEVREGEETPMDVNFDFLWDFLKGNTNTGATPTVEDALKRRGAAAAWVSTDADPCRPYSVNIVLENVPGCGVGDQEIITLPDFRWDSIDHDLRAGSVAVTGRCNALEATIVRSPIPST